MSKALQIRPKRVLVAYSAPSTFVSTTLEYLMALKNFTDYDVKYVHVTHDAQMHFDITNSMFCSTTTVRDSVSTDI